MNEQQSSSYTGTQSVDLLLEAIRLAFLTVFVTLGLSLALFIRYDFGERYLTIGKALATFLVFYVFSSMSAIGSIIGGGTNTSLVGIWLLIFFIGFPLLCMYHFWRIWVNRQLGEPQYSHSQGRSRLEPLARIISQSNINPFRWLAVAVGRIFLSREDFQRLRLSTQHAEASNPDRLASLWLDPLLGILLAMLSSGVLAFWLCFSATALFISTYMIYQKDRKRELDIADNIILAAVDKDNQATKQRMRQEVSKALEILQRRTQEEPVYAQLLQQNSPDVMAALEELDIHIPSHSHNL